MATDLRTLLADAHQSFVGEVRTMSDGYGSFVHFGPEEMAAQIAAVVARWLRAEADWLGEELRRDRDRPDGGDQLFRSDTAMQMLAIKSLADTLTDTQETDR